MSGTGKDEPYNDFLEEVYIGTDCIHRHADVIVFFDSRTGGKSLPRFRFAEDYKITEI